MFHQARCWVHHLAVRSDPSAGVPSHLHPLLQVCVCFQLCVCCACVCGRWEVFTCALIRIRAFCSICLNSGNDVNAGSLKVNTLPQLQWDG